MSEFHNTNDAFNNIGPGGFSFDNYHRNQTILRAQANNGKQTQTHFPSATKTGTTIVGMTFDGGVVLGADTRATNGTEVADKNCEKIHYLADNLYCCGAGTAADTEMTTQNISSQLALLRMNTKSESRAVTACTMLKRLLFRYQGHISAALVLGGVDETGAHIYQIHPHGSTSYQPYTTMGSGSLAAMAVFETEWREGMNEKEAVELVKKAILAGVWNDLGSGSNVDVCVIRSDRSVEMMRNLETPNEVKPYRDQIRHSSKLSISSGTTAVLKKSFAPHKKTQVTLDDIIITPMETSA